jgi:hypothetical protein
VDKTDLEFIEQALAKEVYPFHPFFNPLPIVFYFFPKILKS